MPDQSNYLLGNGERLTHSVERHAGGSEKQPAYDFETAVRRIGEDLSEAAVKFHSLPDGACPRGEAVAAVTMHPRYLSKSDHPLTVLNQVGLRALGSKSAIVAPEEWGISKHPEQAVTTVLFVAGKRSAFDTWSSAFSDNGGRFVSHEIVKFESITALTAADRIRSIPDVPEVQLELVLHSDRSGLITEAFEAYAIQTGDVFLDLDRRREVGDLCFLPAKAAKESIERLAQFTFLRVVRGMPKLRPLVMPGFRVSSAKQQVDIPTGPSHDPSTRVAVFDGGIPDGVSFPWVNEIDTIGVGPKHELYTAHGLAVTSAVLFGHADLASPLNTPFTGVDHFRVLGIDTGSNTVELYDVLGRIVQVLEADSNSFEFINLSLGPRMEIDDDDVTVWTAQLDELLGRKDILATVAVGNDGKLDDTLGLNRVQPPSDGVNVLAVGSSASTSQNWKVADYSCVGPGRCPGLVKPDVIAFGGSISEPFLALESQNEVTGMCGTSFAAPAVLRLGAGVKATFGPALSPLAIRALLVHHSDPHIYHQKSVGWGRVPDDISKLISSDGDTVHVVYQGEIPFGVQVRANIPEPAGGFEGMVSIAATFCISSSVDPHHANSYTRSGLDVVFRPHEEKLTEYGDGSTSHYAKPASFFSQRQMYPSEYILRNDTHKWEPVLKSAVRKRSSSLKSPCFDIYRSERQEGAAPSEPDSLKYALIVTVSARKMTDLYDRILRTYNQVLVPLQPRVDVQVRT